MSGLKKVSIYKMNIVNAFKLLERYNIPAAPYIYLDTNAVLKEEDLDISYPVVIKVVSRKIIHKTEVGGIKLNISNFKELAESINIFKKKFGTLLDGFLIQKMITGGIELALGGVRDPIFGPLVSFGSGGIYIELFGDVSFRAAPLDINEAIELIKETKASKLLSGYRGIANINIYKIAKLITSVSKIMLDNENIREIDINPLMVTPKYEYAVDVRIIVSEEKRDE